MKLHALNREFLMSQAHDDAGSIFVRSPGADFEVAWQIVFGDDQGVITGCGHRRRQSAKDGFAIVFDLAGFAVHQILRADHFSSKGRANRLMAEADSEERHFVLSPARKMADDVNADAGFLRSAGPRRNNDALRMHRFDRVHGHLVVAANFDLLAQFTEILDKVVSKRIVVIEDEDHDFIVAPRRRFQSFKVSRFQGCRVPIIARSGLTTLHFLETLKP